MELKAPIRPDSYIQVKTPATTAVAAGSPTTLNIGTVSDSKNFTKASGTVITGVPSALYLFNWKLSTNSLAWSLNNYLLGYVSKTDFTQLTTSSQCQVYASAAATFAQVADGSAIVVCPSDGNMIFRVDCEKAATISLIFSAVRIG